MNKRLEAKLKELPKAPGVYFHKNAKGDIIYVGKAAVLKNRVRQYFQSSRPLDPKTEVLVSEIADIEWITVETEIDALFLEAELIRRYRPPYNILLRDDKSYVYIRINYDDKHPTVTLNRRPLDDKAKYFGPYSSTISVRRALKYLRRAFPFSTHLGVPPKRACLQYHLGLCPGIEEDKTPLEEYRANLRKLTQYLKGERVKLVNELERDMKKYAKNKDFEAAGHIRDQLLTLKNLSQQIIFSDKEFMDLSRDHALSELTTLLGLAKEPRRIEGYDISHMSGTDNVASMVVFTNGLPDKTNYRKFKMRLVGNDDFGHMREVITRRLREENVKKWGLPDIFLIDGGKGQLSAAIEARDARGYSNIPMIGLAKREEEIVVHIEKSNVVVNKHAIPTGGIVSQTGSEFVMITLPHTTNLVKFLQRIRDESHRFAVSYHTVLKRTRQTASLLEEIPGFGPETRKKLLKTFGSVKALMEAPETDIVKCIGSKKAELLLQYLRAQKNRS